MKRKRKRQITTVVVAVFFLAAGLWYFLWSGGLTEKQEKAELKGVLELADASITPVPEQEATDEMQSDFQTVVVYVCGAVKEPGIYTLTAGSRLYEAVTQAGGFSKEADPAYHNLARTISDGERIYILSAAETKVLTTEQQVSGEEGAGAAAAAGSFPINLNTATAEQLMELPGIGEARAADILAYRAKIGQFTDVEEIMNVSGIGEAMFEKMKEKITVK